MSIKLLTLCLLVLSTVSFAFQYNEAGEPSVDSKEAIKLLTDNTFKGWSIPSTNWSVVDNTLIGSTGNKKLSVSQ